MDQETIVQSQSETAVLNRVLGRKELFSMAAGQIIGAGIMALTGIGIALTGRSVNLAFIIAAVFTILMAIPFIFLGGTVRLRGGTYSQMALLMGKLMSGAYLFCYIASNVSIAIYAISFASYFLDLTGLAISPVLVAGITMTLFYLLNVFGIQGAAIVQNAMVVCLVAALIIFMAFGVGRINWTGAFGGDADWMTGGVYGLFYASCLLTYATGGATVVINFGAEAKNPVKDVPFVIIASTLCIAVVYAIMATVAAGVLPIAEVAGRNLVLTAREILPAGFYEFFIVGGAIFALLTTLNATLSWVTKPLLQATVDGWFPKSWAKLTKWKTPIVWLTIFYVIGMVPILFNIDLGFITTLSLIIGYIFGAVQAISLVNMPKAIPEIWAKSRLHCSNGMLWAIGIVGAGSQVAQFLILSLNQEPWVWWGNLGLVVFGFAYSWLRIKAGKINMEVSYEAA